MCHLSTHSISLNTNAIIETLPESYVNYYSYISVKIICPNINFINSLKVKVMFITNNKLLETFSVPVFSIEENNTKPKTIDKNENSINEIVVCVRPLFGPFSSLSSILEFIAYYRVNGINRFIFYELSITSEMSALLHNIPFVKLLSFHLPIDSNDIHANGQIAAINDCLLRSTPYTVILVDIDELIVTKTYTDIKSYVNYKTHNQSIGALVIPNVMICSQFNANYNEFPRILNSKVRQLSKWRHRDRSKVIILRPLLVAELGIHTVWLWNSFDVFNENVDESEAMLFHYRSCCRVWQTFYRNSYTGINLYFLTYNDLVISDNSVRKF